MCVHLKKFIPTIDPRNPAGTGQAGSEAAGAAPNSAGEASEVGSVATAAGEAKAPEAEAASGPQETSGNLRFQEAPIHLFLFYYYIFCFLLHFSRS
jgi:hypothetical protein